MLNPPPDQIIYAACNLRKYQQLKSKFSKNARNKAQNIIILRQSKWFTPCLHITISKIY